MDSSSSTHIPNQGPDIRLQGVLRPDEVARLTFLPEVPKSNYVNFLTSLWNTLQAHPRDSQEYQQALTALQNGSNNVKSTIQKLTANFSNPSRQHALRAGQTQDNGQPMTPSNSQLPRPVSDIPNQIRTMSILVPPDYATPADQVHWIHEVKIRLARSSQQRVNAQSEIARLQPLHDQWQQRIKAGQSTVTDEFRKVAKELDEARRSLNEASNFLTSFKKQQDGLRQQTFKNRASQQVDNGVASTPSGATTQDAAEEARLKQQTANQDSDHSTPGAKVNAVVVNNPPRPASEAGGSMQSTPISNIPGQQHPMPLPIMNNSPPSSTSQNLPQGIAVTAAPSQQHSFAQQPVQPTQNNSPQIVQPQSNAFQGPPRPLSHQAAVQQAAQSYSNQSYTSPTQSQNTQSQQRNSDNINNTNNNTKMPIPKTMSIPPPQPVSMPPARPTLSGGPSGAGMGVMGQPAIQKHPGFVLEGEGEHVLSKKRLNELVRQVTGGGETVGGEGLSTDVEETLLNVADEFVDQVTTQACRLAKARGSSSLDIRDIQVILERNYNIRIPGYASDELRTVRKFQPAQGWTQKMSAVQAAKVTGGKTDI